MSKVNNIKISKQNRLHDLQTYDFKNLVFADPYESVIGGTNPPVKYRKINILTKNEKTREVEQPGGTIAYEEDLDMRDSMGNLLFLMDSMFSFGIQESRDFNNNTLTGYNMSLALDDQHNSSDRQLKTVSQFEKLILECKKYLLANRKELKLPKLDESDLKSMNKLIYQKKDEDGDRIPGTTSTISPKLYHCDDDKTKFETKFYLDGELDEDGEPVEVDPLKYLSDSSKKNFKFCHVRPVVRVESIYIGSAISIQLKITEAIITPSKPKTQTSLLHRQFKRK